MLRFALLSFLLLLGSAQAEPSDEMFERLKTAPSESEAHDVALDIWATWMESGSATVDILMQRGAEAQTVGDFETAREMYDRAILISPDYAEAWNRRASIFLSEENFTEALRDINETLVREPRHFGAWAGLGQLMEAMSAPKEALVAYREALKIYPTMPQALQAERRLTKTTEGQGL